LDVVLDLEKILTGIFYQIDRPEYVKLLQDGGAARGRELDPDPPKIDVGTLIQRFS